MTGEETKMRGFFAERCLIKAVNTLKHSVIKKDADVVIVIDGQEGSGKSVFTMQLAKLLNPEFSLNDIVFTPEDFVQKIDKAKKFQVILYDEAYSGLASRQSLSAVNKLLVSNMIQMRQKNLFVLIVLPSFFMLDKYVALFRSKVLFHIYSSKGKRGKWLGFNEKKKKQLYLKGQKTMDYNFPRIHMFRGKFNGNYVIDEQKYRKMKEQALKNSVITEPKSRFEQQRNILIRDLIEREKITHKKAEGYLESIGFVEGLSLKRPTITKICNKKRDVC